MALLQIAIRDSLELARQISGSFDWRQSCGYFASALVLATFWMSQMIPLRVVAICSNVAFFSYAALLGLPPVAILHAVLLPVNVWRLRQLMTAAVRADPTAHFQIRNGARLAAKAGLAIGLSLLLMGATGGPCR